MTLSLENVQKFEGKAEDSYIDYFDVVQDQNSDDLIGRIVLDEGDGNNPFPAGVSNWLEIRGTLSFGGQFDDTDFNAGIMIGYCYVWSQPVNDSVLELILAEQTTVIKEYEIAIEFDQSIFTAMYEEIDGKMCGGTLQINLQIGNEGEVYDLQQISFVK